MIAAVNPLSSFDDRSPAPLSPPRSARRVVALFGNPNVGKSSLFNGLTGLRQHTGNWPGKTVSSARGLVRGGKNEYELIDIPGAYSLSAQSEEEAVARDFLCFGNAEAVIIVCDATCLIRNISLALQILELKRRALVVVNLMDQAKKRGVSIDFALLSERLSVPVIGVSAHEPESMERIKAALDALFSGEESCREQPLFSYAAPLEEALSLLQSAFSAVGLAGPEARFWGLRLLEGDAGLLSAFTRCFGFSPLSAKPLAAALAAAAQTLSEAGLSGQALQDEIAGALARSAEAVCKDAIRSKTLDVGERDRRVDRVALSRRFGFPLMALLLALVFFITVQGANVPSAFLSRLFLSLENRIRVLFLAANAPPFLMGLLVDGMYRVLSFVVAVMLPPMAIFFPLFTLLEDLGYLPRVAFNLDRCFQKCRACGKQALTMWVVDKRMPRDYGNATKQGGGAGLACDRIAIHFRFNSIELHPTVVPIGCRLLRHPSSFRCCGMAF